MRKLTTHISLMLLFLILISPKISAQPAYSRGEQRLPITYEVAMQRAKAALIAEGYINLNEGGAFISGYKVIHTAVIMCNVAPDNKTWVNIVVASYHCDGNAPGAERVRLQGRMDQPSGSTAVNNPPSNITGTWIVKQGLFTGILNLFQSGTTLSGAIDWDGYDDGTIKTGSYIDGKVVFVLSYPNRTEGTYNALVDNSGKMTNGTTSSTQGSTASWTATKN